MKASNLDTTERQIERAFRPGEFIDDGACFSFVSSLEEITAGIGQLVTTQPLRAVALYEAFLAGCHAKADELDDSSGRFGQFARDLICGWIKARQASGAVPEETVSRLLPGWMMIPMPSAMKSRGTLHRRLMKPSWRPLRRRFERGLKPPRRSRPVTPTGAGAAFSVSSTTLRAK